jgi:hypothetical protein
MSKTDTTRVTLKPGDPLPRGDTDWARLDAMTDEEVVAAALSDPDAQPLTPDQLVKMRRVSRVKVLRQSLSMTQAEFARHSTCRSRLCAIGSSTGARQTRQLGRCRARASVS